jgi:hypothetical protein
VLAQRAAWEGPRWTRAVGIISATPCNVIVHSTVNRAEEIEMKKSRCSMVLVVGLLAVVGLWGCNQETPIEKTKAAAASGSAATQAAGQASVDAKVHWSSQLNSGLLRLRKRRSRTQKYEEARLTKGVELRRRHDATVFHCDWTV